MTYADNIRAAAVVLVVIVSGTLLLWLGAAGAQAKPHHQHLCKPVSCHSLDR